MSAPGTTLLRRQIGRRLREYRERSGHTMRDVVDARIFSESKLHRLERGQGSPRIGDILALCRFYQATQAETDQLVVLAEGANSVVGWWEGRGIAENWVSLYLDLEAHFSTMLAWHPTLVHGLLQSPEYARAVIDSDGITDEAVIAGRLRLRNERQTTFQQRRNRHFHIVLGASALSWQLGSRAVLRGQIERLSEWNQVEGVEIRVLPFTTGALGACTNPFALMDFRLREDPSVVYIESLLDARYLEEDRQVRAHRNLHAHLMQQSIPIEEYSTS